MPITLTALCLLAATILASASSVASFEIGTPRQSSLSRRAIDGTRGRKYFDPEEEGTFDSLGSAGGQYDPYEERTDLADIRVNVPGEPGVDYPAYTTLPQTGFSCEGRARGYYADETAGCQLFHVCDEVLISSFLCPIGSVFSQKLLTCDWWNKVDCPSSSRYVESQRNHYNLQDDDEMIRKAFAMINLRSGNGDLQVDGLLDPDAGTGVKVILPYHAVDNAGHNHLPSEGFDYRGGQSSSARGSTSEDRYTSSLSVSLANRVGYSQDYRTERTPFRDSPIIHIEKIGADAGGYAAPHPGGSVFDDRYEKKNYEEAYRESLDHFRNEFQPSYAPTVPTVTTTTRRFYSPTVPTTTSRPSTLAYGRPDQFLQGPREIFPRKPSNLFEPPVTQPTVATYANHRERYEEPILHYGGIPSNHRVEGRYAEERIDEDLGDYFEDIDTRESIGLARALADSAGKSGVSAQDTLVHQNKVEQTPKGPSDASGSHDGGSSQGDRVTTPGYEGEEREERVTASTRSLVNATLDSVGAVTPLYTDDVTGSGHSLPVSQDIFNGSSPAPPLNSSGGFRINVQESKLRRDHDETSTELATSENENGGLNASAVAEDVERRGEGDVPAEVREEHRTSYSVSPGRSSTTLPDVVSTRDSGSQPEVSPAVAAADQSAAPLHVTFSVDRNEERYFLGDSRIGRNGASAINRELDLVEPATSVETRNFEADGGVPKVKPEVESKFPLDLSNPDSLDFLRVMAELMKTDRLPRPFSLKDTRSIDVENDTLLERSRYHSYEDAHSFRNGGPDDTKEANALKNLLSSTVSLETRPFLKEQILDQLMANVQRPLYMEGRKFEVDLPENERSYDFEDESLHLPEDDDNRSLAPTPRSSGPPEPNDSQSTTPGHSKTSVPPPPLNHTETTRTIVETEVVPAISFSFDTDEGREKYVEAVLSGLLNEPIADRNGSTIRESIENSSRHNASQQISH